MVIEQEPLEVQIRKKKLREQAKAKLLNKKQEQKDLDSLVEELYEVKDRLRRHNWKKGDGRMDLMEKKDALILEIKRELKKVSQFKAEKIRSKMWDELGVMI